MEIFKNKRIEIARHLNDDPDEDIERFKHLDKIDLNIPDRDVDILPGQEEDAKNIAENFTRYALENDYKILIIPTSPKKRTVQSAELIKRFIPKDIKVIIDINDNLDSMNQGKFILPEDYVPGDFFQGLKDAERVFNKEKSENPGYKFGDPVWISDGVYKYPELLESFSESGESYKDVLVRLYSQIVKLSENKERFENSRVGIAVVTHAQGYQIYYDLPKAAEMIKNGREIKPGGLAELCWELYKTRTGESKMKIGESTTLSVEDISDETVLGILKKEIEYLKNI